MIQNPGVRISPSLRKIIEDRLYKNMIALSTSVVLDDRKVIAVQPVITVISVFVVLNTI